MSRFITYLNEGRGKSISQQEALEFAEKNCTEAINSYKKGNRIFRGIEGTYGNFARIKPIGERKSANTNNYYTLFINYDGPWKEYPKREIICSSADYIASQFGDVYVMLPINGAKIGIVPEEDIWFTFDSVPGGADNVNVQIHNILRQKSSGINLNNFNELKKALSEIKRDDGTDNILLEILSKSNYDNLYELLSKEVFNPNKNGFKVQPISRLSNSGKRFEVWTDVECLMIDPDVAIDFVKEL